MSTERRFGPGRIISLVIGGLFVAALLAFVLGAIVMLLWNWLMPDIFGLTEIGYWQAWGLVFLAHILFKAGHKESRNHRGEPWKDRFRKRFEDRFKGKFTAHWQQPAGPDQEEQKEEPMEQG